MFGIERFKRLSLEKQLAWYNQANECRLANVPPTQINDEVLCACIWMGEVMLQIARDYPYKLFSDPDYVMTLHLWVISLKHEWIERESKRRASPRSCSRHPATPRLINLLPHWLSKKLCGWSSTS